MSIATGGDGIRPSVGTTPEVHEATAQKESADRGRRKAGFDEMGMEEDAVASRLSNGQGGFDEVV